MIRFMRHLTLIAALLASSSAMASFDLVMVADRGTKSVHRFDGNTGLYLGSFGAGFLQNPMSMALDQANNRVFVADQVGAGTGAGSVQVRIWSFNYNTGSYLNSFSTAFTYINPQIAYQPTSNRVFVGHDGGIADSYSAASGSFGPGINWLAPQSALATAENGDVWAANGTIVQRFSGSTANYTMASPVSNTSGLGQRQMAISNGRILTAGGTSFSTFSTTLSTTAANSLTTTATSYSQLSGAAFGHGNLAYITGSKTTTTGAISRILYNERLVLSEFGGGVLQEPRSMVVVVAPEPGSMIALGAGLVALLRKRKISKS